MTQVQHSSTVQQNQSTIETEEKITASLFTQLPFHQHDSSSQLEDDLTQASQDLTPAEIVELEKKPHVCLPYIPKLYNQLKRILNKAGCKTYFKSETKLKGVLCSKNKTRPPWIEQQGVYKSTCPCSPIAVYVGQTSGKFTTRTNHHGTPKLEPLWTDCPQGDVQPSN
jgi:hypothetical protein